VVQRVDLDVVVHLLTSIPDRLQPRRFADQMRATNRLRRAAMVNLRSSARPTTRFVTASVAFLYDPTGGSPADESRVLWHNGPRAIREVVAAIGVAERVTTAADGVVLRFGHLYGPGTHFAPDGDFIDQIAHHRVPIVGQGGSTFSFVHVADAASAIERAIRSRAVGTYNIVDDDPTEIGVWLPEVARQLGAKAPARVPRLLGRVMGGSWGEAFTTSLVGASNARARADLGWRPSRPSWRTGLLPEVDATPLTHEGLADTPGSSSDGT
jgi:nucleoside-diphosphate-sugar epimerase